MVASLITNFRRLFHWLITGNDYHYCELCNVTEPHNVAVKSPSRFDDATRANLQPVHFAANSPTRIINYWSDSGHFFRWSYRKDQLQQVQRHLGKIAADPAIEFTWHDAARVCELIRFMELTQDCQDVVGW